MRSFWGGSPPLKFAAGLCALLIALYGCSSGAVEPAESDEGPAGTIRIGIALSETGKFALESADLRRGYETWLTWVRDEYGGIRVGDERYDVTFIYYDDQSDEDLVGDLVRKLIVEDEVDFLLGPYSSTMTFPASAASEEHGVIMLEGGGASDALFERGYRYMFFVGTVASEYTRSGIAELAARGARTAVIAYEDRPFPTAMAEGAVKQLAEYGIELLAVESYPPEVHEFDDMIHRFLELAPDVFIGGGHYLDAYHYVEASAALGFSPDAMLLTVGPSNPRLIEELGDKVEGVLGPSQWEAYMGYIGSYFGSALDFANYYESLWGIRPTYQAAGAAATALALQLGIEGAGSLATEAVRQALLDLDVITFYGPMNFDSRGANIAKPAVTVQIQDGEVRVVAPDAAAVVEMNYPA